ncbi:MAG: His-Xaa-Ser system radical SAM maturase HxsC [Janthinobacterium sp.]|jgi:His-Xaa-Ser system radical SAM maturase HxsC
MIKLNHRGITLNLHEEIIGVVSSGSGEKNILLISDASEINEDFDGQAILVDRKVSLDSLPYSIRSKIIVTDIETEDIELGDIILLTPNGKIRSLFRKASEHNSLFITDRCNSNCLMCSQPPKNKDDLSYFYDVNQILVSLMPKDVKQLGITGGELTLLGTKFINLLSHTTSNLPNTHIHVLTNGRSFAWLPYVKRLQEIDISNIVFGIPLYSDYFLNHDYIVQSSNAFTQTMQGLYNLARYNSRIEIRIVLHKQTYHRLPKLAKYIQKNLPFVEHVAFMGLEYVGHTLLNRDSLWIEPGEYMNELEEAVTHLDSFGMEVSIYNLQHCLLKESLWKFSRNSISDWKQEYLSECIRCTKINECGGVFATSKRLSTEIHAI